jgi:hypothetical protein
VWLPTWTACGACERACGCAALSVVGGLVQDVDGSLHAAANGLIFSVLLVPPSTLAPSRPSQLRGEPALALPALADGCLLR